MSETPRSRKFSADVARIFHLSPEDVASANAERQRKRDERARFLRMLRAQKRMLLDRLRQARS